MRSEQRLWKARHYPQGTGTPESGTGMGGTLNITAERGAYMILIVGIYALRNRLEVWQACS